jgi:hypothetical protein
MPGNQLLRVTALLLSILAFATATWAFARVVGTSSPWMGLPLMSCVLGLSKVAEPFFTVKLPGWVRPIRAWEGQSGVYRRLAVDEFGGLLRDTPLRVLNLDVYVSRGRHDLREVLTHVESAEASHFWAAAVLTPFLVRAIWERTRGIFACLLIVQAIVNLYPIMHLRRVRGRLERVNSRVRAGRRPAP